MLLSVGMLTDYLKALLEKDERLSDIWVRGEISNITYHRNGNLYFTLKDDESQIRCVVFKCNDRNLDHGMRVKVNASISVFKPYGSYQLNVKSIHPDGVGDLHKEFLRIKEKLKSEGLFDESNKKALPPFPRRIGIITAEQGAALQDLLSNITRRYPPVNIIISPSLVQGTLAAHSIISALQRLKPYNPDIIILARGGGSLEDLWSFNDEALARKIFHCSCPIVSAVGHETDFTIADFVSDLRAPTPSTAAEMVVPDKEYLLNKLSQYKMQLMTDLKESIDEKRRHISDLLSRPVLKKPYDIINTYFQYLDILSARMRRAMDASLKGKEQQLKAQESRLKTLDPQNILRRGYCMVTRNKELVSAESLNNNDIVNLTFFDGKVMAEVRR
ncbi:MAG: exodeoxyribonuclease VII large subunit [Candidatus Woesearchaeota archaeon]